MAEAIGTAIGVVGFLGQLFDGCVKAYGYFSAAAGMDSDSARLLCKVRIEEMRLVVWGREWGVAEGRLEAHLRSGGCNPQMAALAEGIMRELHATVTDFQRLREKYGLVDGEGGKGGMVLSGGGGEKVKQTTTTTDKSWRKEFSRRAKWVIAGMYCFIKIRLRYVMRLMETIDKDKFTALLKDLKGIYIQPTTVSLRTLVIIVIDWTRQTLTQHQTSTTAWSSSSRPPASPPCTAPGATPSSTRRRATSRSCPSSSRRPRTRTRSSARRRT